ncbi:hypothetical protein ADUPG1_000562, partial [Aduncisulcus paluster]
MIGQLQSLRDLNNSIISPTKREGYGGYACLSIPQTFDDEGSSNPMIMESFHHFVDRAAFSLQKVCVPTDVHDTTTVEKPPLYPSCLLSFLGLSITILLKSMIYMGSFQSIPFLSAPSRRISFPINSLLFFFALLTMLQSVHGECDVGYSGDNCQYGFSVECGRYISESDHLECNEIYSGHYAAECESGYYFAESTLSCLEDSSSQCSAYIDGNTMCYYEEHALSPTTACRVAWYGDSCDDRFSVYIPDQLFRAKGCEAYGYDDEQCDLTEFEMATFTGSIMLENISIKTFEGAQNLINISEFYCDFTDITSVAPFSALTQLVSFHPYKTDDTTYSTNVYDISSLYVMNRLYYVDITGNESIYDISVLFRNIGIAMLPVANTDYTTARIPICRSETDTQYRVFLTSVFPTFDTNSSSLYQYYLPNSCPLNAVAGEYYCDPGTEDQCPSVVLNEVYNSLDGVDSKESMLPVANTDYTTARIPICRSETDTQYRVFLTSVFPTFDTNSSSLYQYYLPNSCPLNAVAGEYYCDPGTEDQCPSVVLNEVYNSLDGVDSKECAFIAKEGDNGECYTVHDDEIRAYLSDNGCLTSGGIESNGVISIASLRVFGCATLKLSDIVTDSSNISDVNEITTLQGLEYATSMLGLYIDGYDLSGDTNSNAEYDKLVVQILAKTVSYTNDYGSIDSGLLFLSVSGCGLTEVSDILDLTPIASGDPITQPFKLTTLDLSDNSISDVSVLITEDIFPAGILTTLDISGNNICDIDGMVSELQAKFTALSSVTYSDQTCHCSASVSSADHQVCREVYPGRWAVECWHGYYLDKASGSCVAACASGYVYDTASATCVSSSSAVDDAIRCQVCEGHSTMMPVLEEGNSSITCGCRSAWYGDDCDSYEFQLYIPDDNFRTSVCEAADYAEGTLCDISEFEMAGISGK